MVYAKEKVLSGSRGANNLELGLQPFLNDKDLNAFNFTPPLPESKIQITFANKQMTKYYLAFVYGSNHNGSAVHCK